MTESLSRRAPRRFWGWGNADAALSPREQATVKGMLAAQGVLTARGGKTSHAAVVARGFGIPCVAGAESLHVDVHAKYFKVGDHTIKEGDRGGAGITPDINERD